MANPYRNLRPQAFWKQAVADCAEAGVDPVLDVPFRIGRDDAVATAGSCFAQHIARTLTRSGFRYLVTETYEARDGVADENYGVFPARFANLYTARQLLQLFDRAYGLLVPAADHWMSKTGAFIDPFRPRIQEGGFPTLAALHADRERHLAAVRRMFERCQVFIFTLGLTETWLSAQDGCAFPLAPGVVSTAADDEARFHNFSVGETVADLNAFLGKLWTVNPAARIILTVSPVSLIATYEDRHVLVSTIASKSVLRAAVEEVTRGSPRVAYFPSYEIITGPQTGARFYEPDLREVKPEGVAFVMSVFERHFLQPASATAEVEPAPVPQPALEQDAAQDAAAVLTAREMRRMARVADVVCDEEAIVG